MWLTNAKDGPPSDDAHTSESIYGAPGFVSSEEGVWRFGFSGVDTDVVDEHLLGEDGGVVGVAGPVAAYGEVEKDIEGVIVDPLRIGREIGWGALDDEVIVEEEFDVVRGPLDGVDVKGVVDGFAGGEREFFGDAFRAAVAGAVEGAVHGVGRADGFEDVDLATGGPVIGLVIVSEEPEGGPDAFAGGELDASLETSVFLGEVILRVDAGGGVVAGDAVGAGEILFSGGDDEVAVSLLDVGGAGGVGFELVVAVTLASGDDVPFCGVRWGAVRSVEFVTPGELPV